MSPLYRAAGVAVVPSVGEETLELPARLGRASTQVGRAQPDLDLLAPDLDELGDPQPGEYRKEDRPEHDAEPDAVRTRDDREEEVADHGGDGNEDPGHRGSPDGVLLGHGLCR